jgi:hypothetical protein
LELTREPIGDAHPVSDDGEGAAVPAIHEAAGSRQLEDVAVQGPEVVAVTETAVIGHL